MVAVTLVLVIHHAGVLASLLATPGGGRFLTYCGSDVNYASPQRIVAGNLSPVIAHLFAPARLRPVSQKYRCMG